MSKELINFIKENANGLHGELSNEVYYPLSDVVNLIESKLKEADNKIFIQSAFLKASRKDVEVLKRGNERRQKEINILHDKLKEAEEI